MPVHPQCRAILDAMDNTDEMTVFDCRDPVEARRLYAAGTKSFASQTPLLLSVENRTVPGAPTDVPVARAGA